MKKTIKKTKYTTLAATLLLTGFAITTTTTLADEVASMKSSGTISYIQDDSSTNPVDPTDPDEELTPEDPDEHEDPTPGPLSIDYVSNLRFGEQKTTGDDTTYYAQLDRFINKDGETVERPNYVQVTDKRGSNEGWHLTVTQDGQFMNESNELTGAVLKLENATLSTPNDGEAPTPNKTISLTPGQASDVIDAKEEQGTGTWADRFGSDEAEGKSSISLSVPGKSKKVQGEYKTSLTWTLTDTPA